LHGKFGGHDCGAFVEVASRGIVEVELSLKRIYGFQDFSLTDVVGHVMILKEMVVRALEHIRAR
jgi:hypothetical protein